MILAIDVHYIDNVAKVVAVLFEWDDIKIKQEFSEKILVNSEYIPGQFYMRELPCILSVFKHIDLTKVEAIIVDGYVFIDNSFSNGLGGHLWEAIDKKVPICRRW